MIFIEFDSFQFDFASTAAKEVDYSAQRAFVCCDKGETLMLPVG
jgi:hypothetical protein